MAENTIINQSQIEIEACDETIIVASNEVEVKKLRLEVIKSALCNITAVGHHINYCVQIKNESEVDLYDLLFKDVLDPQTSYIDGTFEVDGSPQTPEVEEGTIVYNIGVLGDGVTMEICFSVMVNE